MRMDSARIAREDPGLAARLTAMTLPAAVQRLDAPLSCDLIVRDVGAWHIATGRMEPLNGHATGADFRLATDADGLAAIVAGVSPVKLMLTGRVRVRGSRRQVARLGALDLAGLTLAEGLAAGAAIDVDAVFRALPYLIDPSWTRGHTFVVGYHVGDGSWYVHVGDGVVSVSAAAHPHAAVHTAPDVLRRIVAGELTPGAALREGLVRVEGKLHPVALLARWIERAHGRDDAEREREERQRLIQANRLGAWGSHPEAAIGEGALHGYGELYALGERQRWSAHAIDLSADQEQWVALPGEAQEDLLRRIAAAAPEHSPLLPAAPSGELEVLIAAQAGDAARHVALFDRFAAEVLALAADDARGRMSELGAEPTPVRGDFVDVVVSHYLVAEGERRSVARRSLIEYLASVDLLPGFRSALELIDRDAHRHVAFAVRFVKDAIDRDPALRPRIEQLVPSPRSRRLAALGLGVQPAG